VSPSSAGGFAVTVRALIFDGSGAGGAASGGLCFSLASALVSRFHPKKEVKRIAVNQSHALIAPASLRTKDLILRSFISL